MADIEQQDTQRIALVATLATQLYCANIFFDEKACVEKALGIVAEAEAQVNAQIDHILGRGTDR